MYKRLQNYTFKICYLFKYNGYICKYNIFTGGSLFTSCRKTYPRTRAFFCQFDTVFILVVNLCKFQTFLKSILPKIVSWLGKHFWCLINDRVTMVYDQCLLSENVRHVTRCYSILLVNVDIFFVLDFSIILMCVWSEKKLLYCLFLCTNESIG